MKREESPAPDPSPTPEPTLARETPEVEALLRHYRSRSHARRQRRRRRLLLAGSGLLGGGILVVAVLLVLPRARDRNVTTPLSAPATSSGPPPRAAPDVAARSEAPPAVAESTTPSSARRVPSAPSPALPKPSSAASQQSPAVSAERASSPSQVTVRPQPNDRLAAIRPGDPKERVFDLFGSTVEREKGALVRIEGMRLRATGRSPDHPLLEVADVEVAENGGARKFWFLFGEGRLLAWGRPEEWRGAATRLQMDIEYR